MKKTILTVVISEIFFILFLVFGVFILFVAGRMVLLGGRATLPGDD